MLKINLTHLFDPFGVHWLKLGVGGREEIKKNQWPPEERAGGNRARPELH